MSLLRARMPGSMGRLAPPPELDTQVVGRADRPVTAPDRFPASSWIPACAAILLLQALLVLTHEPWYDEWQALQIAFGSPDTAALLDNLRYEGHPPLWYVILRLVALIVPTAAILPGVQLVIALSAQGLILFRLTLPRLERVAFALSYVMLIEVGSLARSLSLGALTVIVAVTARSRPARWIAVALLPMADFQFGLMSLALIWLLARDRDIWWPGLGLWLVSSLLAAWSVIPPPDMVPAQPSRDIAIEFLHTAATLAPQLLPLHMMDGRLQWGGMPPLALAILLGPIFVMMAHRILSHGRRERMAFVGLAVACILFSIFVSRFGPRHFAMLALFLVLLCAHAAARGKAMDRVARRLWAGWLAVGAMGGLFGTVLSLVQPFDASARAAQLLERQGLADRPVVVWPEVSTQGIGVHLRREFTGLTTGCTESFHRWNRPREIDSKAALSGKLRQRAAQWGRFYLLTEYSLDLSKSGLAARQVGAVPGGYNGYRFHLFEIGSPLPGRAVPTGACMPDHLPIRSWWRE